MEWVSIVGLGITIVTVVIAPVAVWAHNQKERITGLSGRLDGHDILFREREKRADERHAEIMERFDRLEQKD